MFLTNYECYQLIINHYQQNYLAIYYLVVGTFKF